VSSAIPPLQATLALQRAAYLAAPVPSEAERRRDLKALRALVSDHRDAICEAISQDFGYRSRHEILLTDIVPVLRDIDHTLANLRRWMRPRRRPVDRLAYGLASNRVVPQPVGVVGVIVPWNFPVFLSVPPLAAIFAAGNRAMVKMSENSRHLTRLLIDTSRQYLPPEKLAFFEETGGVGIEFSKLPFDHLLFTGSTQTGRSVMAAAAPNLCPVTLELGGRSPALVCDDFDIDLAAQRLMFGKLMNAGQACVAVDHVYLPRAQVERFVEAARRIVPQRYPALDCTDYTSLIDDRAYRRLTDALDEAAAKGATVIALMPPPHRDEARHRLAPHLVLGAPDDCALMQREIFGPILPVLPYDDLQEVVTRIVQGPRPLAFYPFTHQSSRLRFLLDHVMSGGVTVNDTFLHVGQSDLPFGGIGASGMGHYHGREGFETFSKMRAVHTQSRLSLGHLIFPPYGRVVETVLRFLGR
jgi:coniferyl-aldehyde dehydrogenase